MNCKPGDLAVVIRSWAGNEGRVVQCIELDAWKSNIPGQFPDGRSSPPEPIWVIDRPLPDFDGDMDCTIADSQLKPIRPQADDARDETLGWLPVPTKETEAV